MEAASFPLAVLEYGTPEYQIVVSTNAVGTERLLAQGTIDATTTTLPDMFSNAQCLAMKKTKGLLSLAIDRFWGDGVAFFLKYGADPSPHIAGLRLDSPVEEYFMYLLALLGDHPVDSPLSDPNFPPPIDLEAPTPLIYAAKENTEGYAVRFLVEHRGADPRLRDSKGRDALYYWRG
jgi:hypothetical protein